MCTFDYHFTDPHTHTLELSSTKEQTVSICISIRFPYPFTCGMAENVIRMGGRGSKWDCD